MENEKSTPSPELQERARQTAFINEIAELTLSIYCVLTQECCPECERPKFPQGMQAGDETKIGWSACVNEQCVAYGEQRASACYRFSERASAEQSEKIQKILAAYSLKVEQRTAAASLAPSIETAPPAFTWPTSGNIYPEDSYVGFCRYVHNAAGETNGIRLCDSDAPGAFKIYKHPAEASTSPSPRPSVSLQDLKNAFKGHICRPEDCGCSCGRSYNETGDPVISLHGQFAPECKCKLRPSVSSARPRCPKCGSGNLYLYMTEGLVRCEGCKEPFGVFRIADFAQFFSSLEKP